MFFFTPTHPGSSAHSPHPRTHTDTHSSRRCAAERMSQKCQSMSDVVDADAAMPTVISSPPRTVYCTSAASSLHFSHFPQFYAGSSQATRSATVPRACLVPLLCTNAKVCPRALAWHGNESVASQESIFFFPVGVCREYRSLKK